jgi:hypothetical protein
MNSGSRAIDLGGLPCCQKAERPERVRPLKIASRLARCYEQPLVEPQVSHFRQVPLRTMVKLPHSEQLSPS